MFWESVIEGLLLLLDWHVLVGMATACIICVLHPILTTAIAGEGKSGTRIGTGFFMFLFGGLFFQALAISAFVLLCLPTLIGSGGFTPLNILAPMLWPVLKAGLAAMFVVVILSLIPVLGSFITNTPGVAIFLQGILILRPLSYSIFYIATDGNKLPVSAFPSFIHSLAYLGISILFCLAGSILIFLVSSAIGKRRDSVSALLGPDYAQPSTASMFVGMTIGPIAGTIPLLMYGRFIGLSIQVLMPSLGLQVLSGQLA